jgi:hypothetical protein
LAVITASTLISPKFGLLSSSLAGPGACGAHEPAQSSTIVSKINNFRSVNNEGLVNFPVAREFRLAVIASYAI